MSMAAAYESAADLPRVYWGGADFTTATKERFGPVRFDFFFGSFSLHWNDRFWRVVSTGRRNTLSRRRDGDVCCWQIVSV
jgi:hypothetical protein